MDKWEYCKCDDSELKQLGEYGWEAYAVYYYCGATYYLKRKIPEPPEEDDD